jgi:uncharacterized protein YdeI (BOF family)
MRNRIVLVLSTFALTLGVVGTAMAWLAAPGGVISIEKARKMAETGDYFAIEGVITKSLGGRIFVVSDDTGEMKVLIPEYLTREKGEPAVSEKIRVSGKYDRKKLDHSVQGMRVSNLYRMGKVTGGRGEGAASSAATTPTRLPTPPAAAMTEAGAPKTVVPNAPRELVDRIRAARVEYEAASKDVDDAAEVYARALYKARDGGQVDPAVVERLQKAEARMAEVAQIIPPLVEEAREAGVDDTLIQMYQQSLGLGH